MRRMYRNVVRDLLVSEILGHKELAPSFFEGSSSRQSSIEREIELKSTEVSNNIVSELKKKGYVEKEPDEASLAALIKEVMKRHGVGK